MSLANTNHQLKDSKT